MTKKVEVSVVMSIYNGARYLRESIESILSQKNINFEFIIVNDGSTDDSDNILNEYRSSDKRVKIIDQENMGLTRSLIKGCNTATGEFIARQDCDDISNHERLIRLHKLLSSSDNYTCVSSWINLIGPEQEKLGCIERPYESDIATYKLLHEKMGPPAHGTVMFRKNSYEKVGGYREQFYYGQDSDLWLRLCQIGNIAYVPDYLYHWRVNVEGISFAQKKHQTFFGNIGQKCHRARMLGGSEAKYLEKAENFSNKLPIDKNFYEYYTQKSDGYYFIGSLLTSCNDPKSKYYFVKSLRYNPLKLKAWIKLLTAINKRFFKREYSIRS